MRSRRFVSPALTLAFAVTGVAFATRVAAHDAGLVPPQPRATFVATTKLRVGHHYKLSSWTNVPISRDGTLRIKASPIARLPATPAPRTSASRP